MDVTLMIHIASTFAWRSLTLSWFAERADTSLSTSAALRRAKDDLESRGARVSLMPERDSLEFRTSWRTGRSWLGQVTGGTVVVEQQADRILVTVRASFWPLALWTALFLAVLVTFRFPLVLIFAFAFFVIGTVVLAFMGLRSIARAALTL